MINLRLCFSLSLTVVDGSGIVSKDKTGEVSSELLKWLTLSREERSFLFIHFPRGEEIDKDSLTNRNPYLEGTVPPVSILYLQLSPLY